MITAALAEQHKAVFFDLPDTKNALLEVLRSFERAVFHSDERKITGNPLWISGDFS